MTKKVCILSLVCSAFSFIGKSAHADEIQDMFLYQANNGASQTDFIRSNVEGLFDGQKTQKRISDQFSFEMVQLKTMHKELDVRHRNTLENMTSIDLSFAGQWFNRIQLSKTRQDVDTFNQASDYDVDQQRMYSTSQGWRGMIGNMKAETHLGMVQCANSGEEKYYPVYGFKINRTFEETNSTIELNIAQEIQSGSYTGIYGNQVFKKMSVMTRIPVLKKLFFIWDGGIGVSQSAFDREVAGVATMSASLEYEIGQNIKGTFGYAHRKLIDMETGSTNAEGHMMSASLAVANF